MRGRGLVRRWVAVSARRALTSVRLKARGGECGAEPGRAARPVSWLEPVASQLGGGGGHSQTCGSSSSPNKQDRELRTFCSPQRGGCGRASLRCKEGKSVPRKGLSRMLVLRTCLVQEWEVLVPQTPTTPGTAQRWCPGTLQAAARTQGKLCPLGLSHLISW